MLTKNGTAKCDHCGHFVSWQDVESGAALFEYGEYCETTLGGPEIYEYHDVTCHDCVEKLKNEQNHYTDRKLQ